MSQPSPPLVPHELGVAWSRAGDLALFLRILQIRLAQVEDLKPDRKEWSPLLLLSVCPLLELVTRRMGQPQLTLACLLRVGRVGVVKLGKVEGATTASTLLDMVRKVVALLKGSGIWQLYEVARKCVPIDPVKDLAKFYSVLDRRMRVQMLDHSIRDLPKNEREPAVEAGFQRIHSEIWLSQNICRYILPEAEAGDPTALDILASTTAECGHPLHEDDFAAMASAGSDPEVEDRLWDMVFTEGLDAFMEALGAHLAHPLSRDLPQRRADLLDGYDYSRVLAELELDVNNAQGETHLPPGRLQFDPDTHTITLDNTPFQGLHPKAFAVYKAIADARPQPITKAQIQGKVRACQGDKIIRRLLKNLPEPLRETVHSGPDGYWVNLGPPPGRRKKGGT
jgi:hypothetical protein